MTSIPSAASPAPSSASADPAAPAEDLSRRRVLGLTAVTLAVMLASGAADPFAALARRMTGGGATERMQPTRQAALRFDVSHGEALYASLKGRAAVPSPCRLVLFVGNSQQYTSSLPRGASIVPGHQVTVASDLLVAGVNGARRGRCIDGYNASAPNQTFTEALWQGLYWFGAGPRPPGALVIQASFDTFRKMGIRAGFQTLLEDARFADRVAAQIASGAPYASEFASARASFDAAARDRAAAAGDVSLEHALRAGLESLPLYRERQRRKESFLEFLYLARVAALRISPTTRRHITGQPLLANFAALRELARLARGAGARVYIYNAPVNPAVSMFYEEEYAAYLARLRDLAAAEGARFADLADAVPADQWGYWIDGPDPIHFDERGHRTLAGRLTEAFAADLAEGP